MYVIDNSTVKNHKLIDQLRAINNILYVDNNGNKGIAFALNLAADLAVRDKVTWLLTMDQDSEFEFGALEKMLSFIQSTDVSNVGIVGPMHVIPNKLSRGKQNISPHEVLTIATSGNLLNLKIYQKCGPFLNDLFIDVVDHEYCLRLNSNGYKVIRIPSARLIHQLGVSRTESILGIKTNVSHHNYVRRYYITRNRLFVGNLYRDKYPKWWRRQIVSFWRDLFKVIFKEQDKFKKVIAIIQGVIDYRMGRLGVKYFFDPA